MGMLIFLNSYIKQGREVFPERQTVIVALPQFIKVRRQKKGDL